MAEPARHIDGRDYFPRTGSAIVSNEEQHIRKQACFMMDALAKNARPRGHTG